MNAPRPLTPAMRAFLADLEADTADEALRVMTADRDELRTALHDLIGTKFYRRVNDGCPTDWVAHLTDAEMARLSAIAGVEE